MFSLYFLCQDPILSNGKILGYNITINRGETHSNGYKSLPVHPQELKLHLNGEKTYIYMTANNSVGVSPRATLLIPQPGRSKQAWL